MINFNNIFRASKNTPGMGLGYTKKIVAILGISAYSLGKNELSTKREDNIISMHTKHKKLYEFLSVEKKNERIFLVNNKYYKGLRLSKNLPLHGQRTHTNAQTAKRLNNE